MTSAGACDRQAPPAVSACPNQDRRRDGPSSSVSSQSKAIVWVECGLTRNRPKILAQCLGPDRIVVRLIFEQCEFRAEQRLLGHDGLVLRYGGLATNSAVRQIVIGQGAGNRRDHGRDSWLQGSKSRPVSGVLSRSVAGGARASGGQCGWFEDAALEPHVLVV